MLEALREIGVEENTIVIFTADNGSEDPQNGGGDYTGWTGPWAGTYFTALEGGLRAPFIMRRPGKVSAGTTSNEIVHIVDLYSTLAAFAGAETPTDRLVDGVDMTSFFQGERAHSGREAFPVFVGDDLYAVKWRNWKWHFIWQKSKYSPREQLSTVPKVVNLTMDPREERNVAEPFNTWTQYPVMKVVTDFTRSVATSDGWTEQCLQISAQEPYGRSGSTCGRERLASLGYGCPSRSIEWRH